MTLTQQLEAILFWKAEPMTVAELAKATATDTESVLVSLAELETKLAGRGIVLMHKDDEVSLVTAPVVSELIAKLAKEQLSHELSKATLETLAIILYKGPISRAEVDYIRGVQSAFMVRQLLVRGLIEKVDNPGDARSFLYRASFDLLAHLGVAKIEDLPEYQAVQKEVESFVKTNNVQPTTNNKNEGQEMTQTFEARTEEIIEIK